MLTYGALIWHNKSRQSSLQYKDRPAKKEARLATYRLHYSISVLAAYRQVSDDDIRPFRHGS